MRTLLSIVSLMMGLLLVLALMQQQVDDGLPNPEVPGKAPAPQQIQQQYRDAMDDGLKHNQRKLDALDETGR
ncbi:hypothetical protein [Hydrogenophaga sp.]|uniref:hypothetical protein n=1 Tax=Hydrogenophaga sp. TaxID=1904254 RepID=UPI003F6D799C